MLKSFDSLFEELGGLPSGSGALACCHCGLSPEKADEKIDNLLLTVSGNSAEE